MVKRELKSNKIVLFVLLTFLITAFVVGTVLLVKKNEKVYDAMNTAEIEQETTSFETSGDITNEINPAILKTDGDEVLSGPSSFASAVTATVTKTGLATFNVSNGFKATAISFVSAVPSGYTLDSAKTTAFQNTLAAAEKSNVSVYINGTSIALVCSGTMYAPSSCASLFEGFTVLTTIDFTNFDTSNVLNMSRMFSFCTALTSITGLNGFNTSKVTTMERMFDNCSALTSIDVSSFNTANVTDMTHMFAYSKVSALNLSNFNTEKVISFCGMFSNCTSLASLDIRSFKIKGYTDVDYNSTTHIFAPTGLTVYMLQNIKANATITCSAYFKLVLQMQNNCNGVSFSVVAI